MGSINEFDIRESFDAMDDEKLGRLSIDQVYTLYLGLGYPKLTVLELRNKVRAIQSEDEAVTVDTVLQILSKLSRDRPSEIAQCFSLVDQDQKGYISAQDIERLAKEVGDPITPEEAEEIMSLSTSNQKLSQTHFRKLLAPPSP